MKKYFILLISLVLSLTSCNHSDDDATPESTHVYTNRVEITSYQDEKTKEIDYNHFFESTLDFKYNKLNQLYEINNAITYRNIWSIDPETETFPNRIINTTTTRSFKYDGSNERILEEKTVKDGKTTINFFTYNDAKQLIAIRNDEKETAFNYTTAGQVESITTTYTKAIENNSVQKLTFDNNNNLVSLEYIDTSSPSTTYYFKYSDLTSVYVGNPINYTLRGEYNDSPSIIGTVQFIKSYDINFLDYIEFVYKGFHLVSELTDIDESDYIFHIRSMESPYKYEIKRTFKYENFYYKSSMIVK
ncbi:hypothetical protein [Myroides sp. WP-1]|uniref:hypothetical protein n=1 Tax=Myroides sp. WP-1 TaxID=2759944 RepID=UPI0015FE63E4|nr:hypothetical protein [Myroides sp. WP-1]MBB1139146.1 hypothetical protein [Myroides sp. WP-1]